MSTAFGPLRAIRTYSALVPSICMECDSSKEMRPRACVAPTNTLMRNAPLASAARLSGCTFSKSTST